MFNPLLEKEEKIIEANYTIHYNKNDDSDNIYHLFSVYYMLASC